MMDLKLFSTEAELRELTGLDHDGLWRAGFNLDDWDFGFCCREAFHSTADGEEGYGGLEPDWDKPSWWLMARLNEYCVGASHVLWRGRHYYLAHHA